MWHGVLTDGLDCLQDFVGSGIHVFFNSLCMGPAQCFTAIATCVLAFLTFYLYRENLNHERKRFEQRASAVRTMLRWEMDNNLQRFRYFSTTVDTMIQQEKSRSKEKPDHLACQFVKLPFPEWKRDVWTSNPELMPEALEGRELAVDRIQQLYNSLGEITEIRTAITDLLALQRAEASMGTGETGYRRSPPKQFEAKLTQLWEQWKEVRERLSEYVNPLER